MVHPHYWSLCKRSTYELLKKKKTLHSQETNRSDEGSFALRLIMSFMMRAGGCCCQTDDFSDETVMKGERTGKVLLVLATV